MHTLKPNDGLTLRRSFSTDFADVIFGIKDCAAKGSAAGNLTILETTACKA